MHQVIACDLGASSGRLFLQKFNGETLTLREVHRFENGPITEGKHFYWNFPSILSEIKKGISKEISNVASIGVDTWGVDFGVIDAQGQLLAKPFSYRDQHTEAQVEKITNKYELFQHTGNEVSSINTVFQLMAIQENYPHLFNDAASILMMPNLILQQLCGQSINEFSIASTSGLLSPITKQWNTTIQQQLFKSPLPLAEVQLPHQLIGHYENIQVVLVPGHDTACALSALPIENHESVFMSLGTWGLIGQEIAAPIVTEAAFINGFTNEGASEGNYRFQKNATGFWIVQQLRKEWKEQGISLSFECEKVELKKHENFTSVIDPNHASFFNPTSMTAAIQQYCQETKQPIPTEIGQYLTLFIRSSALSYEAIIEKMCQLTNQAVKDIYIGGGGANHPELCQDIANSTGLPVHTGPVEASSIGNGLSQLRAFGEIDSLQQGREIVKRSFTLTTYEPKASQFWNEMKEHYRAITGGILDVK